MKSVHRIYTQDLRTKMITKAVAAMFESFTLQRGTGFYRGKPERSIMIEIIGATKQQVASLASQIRKINAQTSVLIVHAKAQEQRIERR